MNNEILKKGKTITKKDFVFSIDWIEENEKIKKNPMKILFDQIKEDLEDQIRSKNKKRIFEKEEELRLSPSTVKEVVKILQPINLYRVDEDLNGRMFEAFLNATVRGKELGQFFTPRTVVKFMSKMADISVDKNYEKTDYTLDACCGSGGFLIEIMADMYNKIDKMNLTDTEKQKLKDKVVKENIWGIDAGKSAYMMISRIARMNMFLHGDGSNRIYYLPDSLDKEINTEEIEDRELLEESEELKKKFKDGLKFDVVLTNPPFSMKYSISNSDEKKILQEYEIAKVDGTNRLKAVKSNVLFIERYYDLLKPKGKLITIIDEAVLNTDSDQPFRDFIKKNFEIRAVISLPKNTFINAETSVKTSILYLVKKDKSSSEQPTTFMAICENVGHKDNGKPDLENNELPNILDKFKKFEETGKI
jgi:type I restriction enzyme M protein